MKKLVSIGMLLTSSMVAAGQQVQVTGTGYDLAEARNDAIQKALMKACKSAVVSDKVFRNYESERNKVVIYNGCLVKNYIVLDETVDSLTRVTIKAEVVQNNLPDRIIKNSDEWLFYDFSQSKERSAQLRLRMANAKSLISEIFLDYPNSAFNLEYTEPYTTYNYNGVSRFNLDYTLRWNPNFINALDSTFDILQDRRSSKFRPSKFNMSIQRSWVSTNYGFENLFFYNEIVKAVTYNAPVIRIILTNTDGKQVLKQCFPTEKSYGLFELQMDHSVGAHWLNFYPNNNIAGTLSFDLPESVSESAEVTIDVVNDSFC